MFEHNFCGVIVSSLTDDELNVTMNIHFLAAPLAGHTLLKKKCTDYPRFDNLISTHNRYQWRTVHKQNDAFKDLEIDQQVIDIDNSKILQLPAVFIDRRRLEHNLSITGVMDQYFSVAN